MEKQSFIIFQGKQTKQSKKIQSSCWNTVSTGEVCGMMEQE